MLYSKAFIQYTKSLASDKYKPLTVDKEKELLRAYKGGSKEAFDNLANGYLRFVIFLIQQFNIPSDVDIMDIVQEGNMGLLQGLSKFDIVAYDCRVSTYCAYWIKFFIGKTLQDALKKRELFTPILDADFGEGYSPVDERFQAKIIEEMSKYCFKDLKDRERLIVNLYHGLVHPYKPKTLQEIASMLHTNLERVRQIKDEALGKIKQYLVTYMNR